MAKGQYTAETNPVVSEKRRLHYTTNREEILERAREIRNTPEGRAKLRESNRKRRQNMSPEKREAVRAYMHNYSQSRKELTAQRRRENPVYHRFLKKRSRLKKFGLTPETADAIFAAQGNGCGICGSLEVGTKKDWHLDHDHASGKFRGILCHGCNTGLGGFKDNPEFLLRAIEYLSRYRKEYW